MVSSLHGPPEMMLWPEFIQAAGKPRSIRDTPRRDVQELAALQLMCVSRVSLSHGRDQTWNSQICFWKEGKGERKISRQLELSVGGIIIIDSLITF